MSSDTRFAVLAEHLECRCDEPCACGADSRAVHTMADEIVALRAERDALRKDADRVNFLQAEHARYDPMMHVTAKYLYDREGSSWANICGDVRQEIDKAITTALSEATP